MHASELTGSCFVAPANPAGRQLLADLKSAGIPILGLVDNLKQADDITELPLVLPDNNVIVVAAGDAQKKVCEGLMQRGVSSQQIYMQQHELYICRCTKRVALFQRFQSRLWQGFIWLSRTLTPKRGVVYYAEQFIDTNVLLAFRYHLSQTKNEAVLLCQKPQLQTLLLQSLRQRTYHSRIAIWWYLSTAKVLIIDHEYTGTVFSLFRHHCQVVQLWHGLPYKYISGNQHYLNHPDCSFISSSEWYNAQVFPPRFSARQYLAFGYPRNDVFMQDDSFIDWCNSPPLNQLQQIISTTGPLWVYMPTYRDGQNSLEQLDLVRLNELCRQFNKSFVLKLHPFISRQLEAIQGINDHENKVMPLAGFEHIYLFPSGMNVYPWLAKSDALITDYSSVVSDYLLHDRPVIFYQYDSSGYSEIRGQAVVDEEHFICGPVARDFSELCRVLCQLDEQDDGWRLEREKLKQKLQLTEKPAAPAIFQHISALAKGHELNGQKDNR